MYFLESFVLVLFLCYVGIILFDLFIDGYKEVIFEYKFRIYMFDIGIFCFLS